MSDVLSVDTYAGEQVLSLFRGVFRVPGPKRSMKEIASEVARLHGCTLDELRGPARVKRIARARQEAMYLIYKTGRFSFPQNGRFFYRHHSTAIYGARAYEDRLAGKTVDRRCLKARAA